MKELIFQKGLMLIKQIYQKNVIFVIIAILKLSVLNMNHDLMQKAMGFNNTTIVCIKENAYRIHFWYMSKDNAIIIMTGSNLVDKRGIS